MRLLLFAILLGSGIVSGYLLWPKSQPSASEQVGVVAKTPKAKSPIAPRVAKNPAAKSDKSKVVLPDPTGQTAPEAASPVQPPTAGRGFAELSPQELRLRAAKVEQEANHELRRLIPLLDLTPQQQDQIFAALVKNSRHYVPGMVIQSDPTVTLAPVATQSDPNTSGGTGPSVETATPANNGAASDFSTDATSPSGLAARPARPGLTAEASAPTSSVETVAASPEYAASPEIAGSTEPVDPIDVVMPFLDAEQQQELLLEETERDEWWTEIMGNLESELNIPALPDEMSGDFSN